jgi:hypothetical protein
MNIAMPPRKRPPLLSVVFTTSARAIARVVLELNSAGNKSLELMDDDFLGW